VHLVHQLVVARWVFEVDEGRAVARGDLEGGLGQLGKVITDHPGDGCDDAVEFWKREPTHVHAPVHELPSTKISCEVAPAPRMPSIAAWLRLKTSLLSMSWYSLLVSKMTLSLLEKILAVVVHHALNPSTSVIICS
jgi:hypothetical protein